MILNFFVSKIIIILVNIVELNLYKRDIDFDIKLLFCIQTLLDDKIFNNPLINIGFIYIEYINKDET